MQRGFTRSGFFENLKTIIDIFLLPKDNSRMQSIFDKYAMVSNRNKQA